MSETTGDVTAMLVAYGGGDRAALDSLLPLVYDELRRVAASYLARERRDHTLQPTALVHEAYMRLINQHSVNWQNRAQFFGLAANMMRRILVNHATARAAAKRGSGEKQSLEDATVFFEGLDFDLLALDEALGRLAKLDHEKVRLVELKFFAGLTTEEIALNLGKSTATIEREWAFARSWLYQTMTEEKS